MDVSLKEYTEEAIRANDKRYEELREADQKAFSAALAALDKAVNAALVASEKAVLIAERNAEKWRDNANEWRAAMTDREINFFPRAMGYVVGAISIVSLLVTLLGRYFK